MLWRALILIALVLPASPAWRMGGAMAVEAGACAPLSRASCCEEGCCCAGESGSTEPGAADCRCAMRSAPEHGPERTPDPRLGGPRPGPWLALIRAARVELSGALHPPGAHARRRPVDRVIAGAPNDVKRERISVWLT